MKCSECFLKPLYLFPLLTCHSTDFDVIKVVAIDLDQPNTDNSDIRFRIISQDPELPIGSLFVINPVTGVIRVNADGLDREVRLLKHILHVLVCFHT